MKTETAVGREFTQIFAVLNPKIQTKYFETPAFMFHRENQRKFAARHGVD